MPETKPYHIIFEGSELTGKSYTIHPVWNQIEKENNSGQGIMDGCHWFNTDIGILGTIDGWGLIDKYIEIAQSISHRNIIFEKFHFTNLIYSKEDNFELFQQADQRLADLNFRLVLTTVSPEERIFSDRIRERLVTNKSYQRVVKKPAWYVDTQQNYRQLLKKTNLPAIEIDNTQIPNDNATKILHWLEQNQS